MTYQLLDSGAGQRLEQFGDYALIRPSLQALWKPQQPELWKNADSAFDRKKGWKALPPSWIVDYHNIKFKLIPTDFGHLGLFPEHASHWDWMAGKLFPQSTILNLFAYSGAATLYLASKGHSVCHLDAAKGMVDWARANALLNQLDRAPIRWIVDDALKFLQREAKRGHAYDALLLDPPSFGRGAQGQVFKIERDLPLLLDLCKKVLKRSFSFILLTCHTPGLTPKILENLLRQTFPSRPVESGEMFLTSANYPLPSGGYARG